MNIQKSSMFIGNHRGLDSKNSPSIHIQKQIQRTQEEMTKLSEDDKMDVRTKLEMKKKLEEQMKEKKAEMENRAEEIEKMVKNESAEMIRDEKDQTGLSQKTMHAMAKVSGSMEEAKALNHVRVKFEGDAHELNGRIAMAERRGEDTTKLTEQLEELEEKIGKITSEVIEKYSDMANAMKEAVSEETGKGKNESAKEESAAGMADVDEDNKENKHNNIDGNQGSSMAAGTIGSDELT
ncbi:MAG: hypothetical protein LBR68_02260 [Lachnoclostridium sp.]|jgi:chromosome segregation ATPase|nr:hypothetical protein [Lachnoclostridium sp.]